MSNKFTIAAISIENTSGNIEIHCFIDRGSIQSQLKPGRIGYSMPGELQNIITHSFPRNQKFNKVFEQLEEGKIIQCPIYLS